MRLWLIVIGIWVFLCSAPGYAENPGQKPQNLRREAIKPICLNPVGVVKKQGQQVYLEIYPEYAPALQGLEGFSHLWVFYWFDENDTPEGRRTLQVHPRRDPANPLTGVFACRAPERPNLIGFTACRIVKVNGNIVEVADLDARAGSPILDLKPYIPDGDAIPEARTPDWLKRFKPPAD
ncbi:MAG: tRNA (N6-threonylcarbamoyladenosine(37)-N6)-methyltransferase TrmO [Desulfobaccales bacterium]